MVREAYYIKRMDQLEKVLGILMQQMQIVASADTLHQEVIKDILVKKGIITEDEFKEFISNRLDIIQKQEEEKQKEEEKKLIQPSAEDTAKIQAASKEAKTTDK